MPSIPLYQLERNENTQILACELIAALFLVVKNWKQSKC